VEVVLALVGCASCIHGSAPKMIILAYMEVVLFIEVALFYVDSNIAYYLDLEVVLFIEVALFYVDSNMLSQVQPK
jgi:hypothetical protein